MIKFTVLLLAAVPVRAAFNVPGFELAYSYPAETALEEKDLRLAQDVWPEMIDRAVKTVDVEQFYVTPAKGEPLDATLAALRRAGQRGVHIRVLLEEKFAANSREGMDILKVIPNLELRTLDWSKISGTGIIHAKVMVVDSTAAYVGSQNWDWRSLKHVHELGLQITEGHIVAGLRAIFDYDWAAAAGKNAPARQKGRTAPDRTRRAYLVGSPWPFLPPGIGDSESEISRLIGEAQKDLSIQVMDYVPTTYGRPKRFYGVFDNALRDASVRGIRVRLAVADWNAKGPNLRHLESLALLPGISVKICTIPPSSQGPIPFARVIHSKYMTVDGGVLWLGTSNWTGGYLDSSRNVELVVKDAALSQRVLQIFEHVWGSSYCESLDPRKR